LRERGKPEVAQTCINPVGQQSTYRVEEK